MSIAPASAANELFIAASRCSLTFCGVEHFAVHQRLDTSRACVAPFATLLPVEPSDRSSATVQRIGSAARTHGLTAFIAYPFAHRLARMSRCAVRRTAAFLIQAHLRLLFHCFRCRKPVILLRPPSGGSRFHRAVERRRGITRPDQRHQHLCHSRQTRPPS